MAADPSDKLAKALVARNRLEDLYNEVYGPASRALHRFLDSLPLSSIPLVGVWSAALAYLASVPVSQVDLARVYLSGLVLLASFCATAFAVRRTLDMRDVPDAVLSQIAAEHDVFAFYPNSLLKRAIARRGSASCHAFREWYGRQREILENRVRDLKEAANQAPAPEVDLERLKPGARQFMSR